MHDPVNPWGAPKATAVPEYDEFGVPQRPGVVFWFGAYALTMALFCGLVGLVFLAVVFVGPDNMDPDEEVVTRVMGGILALLCLGMGALHGAAPFLPRRPWVWIYDLIVIALGLTSCATWLASIPLLIFWLQTPTRRYFESSRG